MRDNIPSVPKNFVYNYDVYFDDSGKNPDVQYGIAEIYAWDTAKRKHRVRRPQSDNLAWSCCVALPGALITSSSTVAVSSAAFMLDNRQIIVALSSGSDAATVGCDLGTVKDTWGLKVGNTGFKCTGLIVDASGRRYVYVRPSGSGGSATLLIVQATADGSAGVIPAKTMTLKADPSLSPNYDLSADPTNYNYFKA